MSTPGTLYVRCEGIQKYVTRYHGKLTMISQYTYQIPTCITVGHVKSVRYGYKCV